MIGAGRRKARMPRKILRVTNDDGSCHLQPQMQEAAVEGDSESDYHRNEQNLYALHTHSVNKDQYDTCSNGFSDHCHSKNKYIIDMYKSAIPDYYMEQENSPPKLIDHRIESNSSPYILERQYGSREHSPAREFHHIEERLSSKHGFSPIHHDRYINYRDHDKFYDELSYSPDSRYYDDHTNPKKEISSDQRYKYYNANETRTKSQVDEQSKHNASGRASYKHQHPEPTPEFPYQCETCDMLFKSMKVLVDHQSTVHENNRQFACRYCSKRFNDKYNMRKHVLIHVGEKRHKCQFCDKAFLRKDHLRSHLQTHYNKKFGCRFCGNRFRTQELYNRHLKLHREEILNNPELVTPEISDLSIDALSKKSTSNTNGSNVIDNNHTLNENSNEANDLNKQMPAASGSVSPSPLSVKREDEVSVTILDEDFYLSNHSAQWSECSSAVSENDLNYAGSPSYSDNQDNENTGQNTDYVTSGCLAGFKCKICTKVFSSTEDFETHSELCGTKDKAQKFQCSKCSIVFDESRTLQEHYKKVHSIDRTVRSPSRWRCKSCNINYPNSKELSRHYAQAHKDAQLFPCSECPKTFTVWHNLKKHMLIHLGDKKHKCVICDKGFVRKDHLNSHMKVHLADNTKFTCRICYKVFRQQVFTKHMAMHAMEEENRQLKESSESPQYAMID